MVMPSSANLEPGADPLIGHTLGGKYTIEQMIGRGGMGHVYSATTEDDGGERQVVIKMIAPPLAQQPQAMARFEREAKRLDGLRHSNIVEMFDYGRDGGRAYIVMEYVDGELLSDFMSRKGPLSLAEFVPIAAQILKGVGHAHSRDLMIRDIKAANVMLCERKGRANFVKIIDFGLAKMLEGEEDITKQHFIGTSGYLSPEQIKGVEIDLRVDVYALGVLFYQMLSGRMPFEAENDTTLLYKHVHEFPTPLSEVLPDDHGVPDELIHLIHDCLEKDPDARPRDANDIVEKLIDCVPMAMFKLPAVSATAERTAISALSTAALNAPTGQTATYLKIDEVTDHQSPAATSDSALASPEPAVATPAPASDEGKSKLGIIIGSVVAAAALAGVAVLFLNGGKDDEADASEDASAQPETADADGSKLETVISEAEALVADGKLDEAQTKLDRVRGQLDSAPELAGTVDRLDKQIEVGGLMQTAKQLDADGVSAAAIKAYEDVIAADPTHAEARARLEELRSEAAPPSEPKPKPKPDVEPQDDGGSASKSSGKKKKSAKNKPSDSKPADSKPADQKPADKADNPFLPTKKKKSNGPFLPTE